MEVAASSEYITRAYRRSACLLASEAISSATESESPSEIDLTACPLAQTVAQNILLRLTPAHSAIPMSVIAQNPEELSSLLQKQFLDAESKNSDTWLPRCRGCGGGLQPGHAGTSVRVCSAPKPSRNQRQRRQQFLRNQKLQQQQKGREYDNRNIPHSKLGQFCEDPTRIPRNCRSYLQLTCGVCRTRSFAIGRDPRRRSTMTRKERQRKSSQSQRRQQSVPATSPAAAKEFSHTENFISFEASPKKRPRKQSGGSTIDSKTIRNNSKKKKVKSELMSFLSSLND